MILLCHWGNLGTFGAVSPALRELHTLRELTVRHW